MYIYDLRISTRMGRPDVPIRIRGGIVQIRSESPDYQAIVAITADMSRCRTLNPY